VASEPLVRPGTKLLGVTARERRQRAGVVRPVIDASSRTDGKPQWLKVRVSIGDNFRDLVRLMADLDLNTVCEQAACPNIYECWDMREATFLIGGQDCTRRCGFCQIKTGRPSGYDRQEPQRVAEAVAHLGLRYVVVTMVARDDLDDRGAWLVAETVRRIHARCPGVGIEVLPTDLGYAGDRALGHRALLTLAADPPDVFAFNVETCRRLYGAIRPAFDYEEGLAFLALARQVLPDSTATKSNLILGLGETDDEVLATMADIRATGVDILTIGQYLRPSDQHVRLDRYVSPEPFARFAHAGTQALGFKHVEAGPMVRSSYHAGAQARAAGVWSDVSTAQRELCP
jgi:lipoic acid synthetase